MSKMLNNFKFRWVQSWILILIVFVAASSLEAQETTVRDAATNVEITKSLSRKFRRDAARLALRMDSKTEDLRYQNIDISPQTVENIYEMLTHIYQQDERAQAIARCNVHTFPNPSIDHMVLVFDREVEWAWPLLDGISETDSEEFNELLDQHDLIIERHVQWNETEDAVTIRSKEPLNMAALSNEFYNIEGINNIDLGIPKIGGNDINLWRKSEGWEIEYVLRFGSYVVGKGQVHIWTYMVDDMGNVRFVSEGGDPLPEYMKCHFDKSNPIFVKNK